MDIQSIVDDQLKFENHMQRLFKSLVRPHIEYENAIWSPITMKGVIAIENV